MWKELWGFPQAFQRNGVRLICVREDTRLNADIRDILKHCPESPSLIVQPESILPFLPVGLAEVDIPTACFQFDTYAYTRRRIRWSMLFDFAVLFHPGFEEQFRVAGHPNVMTLSLAVARELFDGPEEERVFDVGWVGRADGNLYETRRRILAGLARCFRMNDWAPYHMPEQMAAVYKRSKVVVNVGRDDYPQDANLRVFEAMAGGALLITRVPSELTAIGFQETTHFVGYREEGEITQLVRHYLANKADRCRIAEVGRQKVLREHTYDCQVRTLLRRLTQGKGGFFAPARLWSKEQVHLVYLDFHAAHLSLDCARGELRHLARRSLRHALVGTCLIARAYVRKSRGWALARVLGQS